MELVILGLSTILQLVCLVAPGWWIQTVQIHGSTFTSYYAIFYKILCVNSDCEMMSWDTQKLGGMSLLLFYRLGVMIQIP